MRNRELNYRESNVWIYARQLGLPLLVAETVTHYLTGTKIRRNFKQRWPDFEQVERILCHLSGHRELDSFTIKHGLLPYQVYERERTRVAYLFSKSSDGEWYLSDWHCFPSLLYEFETLAAKEETVPRFWERLFKAQMCTMHNSFSYLNAVHCAHVEITDNLRLLFFERAR